MTNQHNNSRYIPQAVKNYLWKSCAGKCAYPECRTDLVIPGTDKDGPATIGEIAHIFAHSEYGPRPNPDGFTEATNSYENLILLCSNHHDEVDVQVNTHTVTDLKRWKSEHEKWIAFRLSKEEFDNADLEAIINWIADNSTMPSTDYTLRPLHDKMTYNHLSPSVQQLITMGLLRVSEVTTYVKHRTKLESKFAERLLKPLSDEYTRMRTDGRNGDLIFEELLYFACGDSLDFRNQAAGLAVIVYFFERCEIFEK